MTPGVVAPPARVADKSTARGSLGRHSPADTAIPFEPEHCRHRGRGPEWTPVSGTKNSPGHTLEPAKVKAAGEVQAAHRKTIEDLEKKVRDATGEVAAQDPRVAEAAKAVAAARDRVRKTVAERTAGEQKAREAARAAWREKFETVINENPEAKALMTEIRSLEDRLRKLRDQMGELRRPVSQAK